MNKKIAVLLVLPLFALSACNKKNVKGGENAKDATSQTEVLDDVSTISGSTDAINEADIRQGEFVAHEGIKPVYFDFDRYSLSEEAGKTLELNARILKEKKWTAMIEGHCDDRGTIEYNLALGQKRARVVRDYYKKLGVSESAMGTISYGEEKPVCSEEEDPCWAKNRRAETKVNPQ